MKKITMAWLAIIVAFTSCEDFLDEEVKSQVTQETYFGPNTTELAVEQFINGIYQANIWAIWDRRWTWFAEVPADCFNHTIAFDVEGQEYDWHDFNSEQYNIFRQWNYIWWPIGRANLFLSEYDFLEENFGDKWTRLKWFKGQALFYRAYNYFIGTIAFGPIPLVLDRPDGSNYPNSSIPELYNQIISDLEEIVDDDLCPEYPQVSQEDLGRITMAAAKSLLAKVYLTKSYSEASADDDLDNAILYAKDVIDESGHDLITEPDLDENGDTIWHAYQKPFLASYKNSVEGIWEYQFLLGGGRSSIQEEFAPDGFYSTGYYGPGRYEATTLLYNSFERGDLRKEVYITGDVVSPMSGEIMHLGNKIYMVKFHDNYGNTAGSQINNWVFLRFSDILLIYAEAVNKKNNGPTQDAFDAINRVRNRAGLPNLTGADDYNSFLKAVQDERFKELAGECHRLWDLRRWGYKTLKERVELSNPKASVEPHEVLYPIPSYELQQNPEIKQNKGYINENKD